MNTSTEFFWYNNIHANGKLKDLSASSVVLYYERKSSKENQVNTLNSNMTNERFFDGGWW